MKLPPAMKTPEVRAALVEYKRTGDIRARNRAARGCMLYVMSRARHYGRHGRNLDDLFQVGCEGLLRSFETYDASKGAPLTHAAQYVDRWIVRHMKASQRMVTMPQTSGAAVYGALAAGATTPDEVVEATRAKRLMLRDTVASIMAIMASTDVGADFVHLATLGESADGIAEREQRDRAVADAVAALPAREREVIRRAFWGEEDNAIIGRAQGVTHERIRQIRNRALNRMRRQLREVA